MAKPQHETSWLENNVFWGSAGSAIGIILTVVAATKQDLRGLLFLAWPFFVLATWPLVRSSVSPRRKYFIVVAAILSGLLLYWINIWLGPTATEPKARLDFSFFTEDPKAVPIQEVSLQLSGGKVTMEFMVANRNNTDAINGWFVLRLCKGCRFANEPLGFSSVGSSPESQQEDRVHPINQIFQGTNTPKMIAEVIPPVRSRRFQVDFFYRCRTCDNHNQAQQMFINVLPE